MMSARDDAGRRDRWLAGLLWYGTWGASAVIAAGMILEGLDYIDVAAAPPGLSGYGVMKAGVALFILLPVARVVLMLLIFLRQRDYAYTAISALVLAIVAAGVLIGL